MSKNLTNFPPFPFGLFKSFSEDEDELFDRDEPVEEQDGSDLIVSLFGLALSPGTYKEIIIV